MDYKIVGGFHLRCIGLLISCFSIIFIFGCASENAEDILEDAKKKQADLEAVEVDFEMDGETSPMTGKAIFDFEKEQSYIDFDEAEFAFYKDQDDFFIEYGDGTVLDSQAAGMEDAGDIEEDTEQELELIGNPLAVYETWDEDIFSKFEMDSGDDLYELHFNGDETDQEDIGQAVVENSMDAIREEAADDSLENSDITVNSFALDMKIDQETQLLKEVKHALDYEVAGKNLSEEEHQQFSYKNYDDAKTIAIPEATETAEGMEGAFDNEDQETLEKDAGQYVEALIEATIFQNEEGFIEKVPDSFPEDSIESDAELQKDFFKETYIQNTMANFEGTGVSEEQVEELADAFMHALSQTKYEVIEQEAQDEEYIIVTLSVEGINDQAIYAEVEDELRELHENGEVDDDKLEEKNIDLLQAKFEELEDLSSPTEVDVEVTKEQDGAYNVYMQDQFLEGFVN